MKRKFKFLMCLLAFFAFSCEDTLEEVADDTSGDTTTEEGGALTEVSFIPSSTGVVTFAEGDEIIVTAVDEAGEVYAAGVSYSYDGTSFTSTSPITYDEDGGKLEFHILYPDVEADDSGIASFSVQEDQSAEGAYESSDLVYSYVAATTVASSRITFSHALSKVVFNVISTDVDMTDAVVTIDAKTAIEYDVLASTLEATGDTSTITMASNGANSYKAVVVPQTISLSSFGSITVAGKSYDFSFDSSAAMEAGKEYTISAIISGGNITFYEPVATDWANETAVEEGAASEAIYSDGTWAVKDCYSQETSEGSTDALFDRDLETYFHSAWSGGASGATTTTPHWVTIDLNGEYLIEKVLLCPRYSSYRGAILQQIGYIETSNDNINWTQVGTFQFDSAWEEYEFDVTATVARYVKISVTNDYFQITGFGICGSLYKAIVEEEFVTPSGTCSEIWFLGNSYVTESGTGTSPSIGYTAMTNWTSSSAVLSSYVYLHSTGEFTLTLQASGSSKIKVTIGDTSHEVTIDSSSTKEVLVGTYNVDTKGYIRIDFQGVESYVSSGSFGSIDYINIYGISKVSYVTKEWGGDDYSSWYWGHRGPSVHMSYTLPSGNTEWFYNEITVPEEGEVMYSYYMACGFGQGYFGMQYNYETERRVLFSVWSPYETDDPSEIPDDQWVNNTRYGRDVTITEFGSEGSGGQSYLVYPWTAGTTYKFLMHIRPNDDGASTDYTAYFYATDDAEWRLIASWNRPITSTWYSSPYSFLENFGTDSGDKDRIYYMGNQWACSDSGVWTRMTKASFTYDATASAGVRLDYQGGLTDDGRYFLRMGGFFSNENDPYTSYGNSYTTTYYGDEPDIDFDALAAIKDGE